MTKLEKEFGINPRIEIQRRLAQWFAARRGDHGGKGGWIYRNSDGRALAHGWSAYYDRVRVHIQAELTIFAEEPPQWTRAGKDQAREYGLSRAFVEAYASKHRWGVVTRDGVIECWNNWTVNNS